MNYDYPPVQVLWTKVYFQRFKIRHSCNTYSFTDNISISSGREIRSSGTSDRSANTLPAMSARPRMLSENYETQIAEQEQGEAAVFNSIHDGSQRSTDGATANQEFMTNDYPNTYELDYSSASSSTRECGVTSTCIIL